MSAAALASDDRERLDKLAKDNAGVWEEAAARLKISEEAETTNRANGIKAKTFRWGGEAQWDPIALSDRKNDGRPALTVNHTDVICSRLENTLRQQRPRIKCHPVGGGASRDDANRINGLIRHIEDISTASVAYDNGAENAIDAGYGYWRIVSDYIDFMSFDQELLIRAIPNPFTVYMDPGAVMPDGRDQKWCIISETMSRQQFKLQNPRAELLDFTSAQGAGDNTLSWEGKDIIRCAEYYRIYEVADTLIQLSDGSLKLRSQWAMKDAEFAAAIQAVGLSVKNYRRTARCAVQWFLLNGKTVVDKREEPAGVYFIPVVRCEANVMNINGKILRKGKVQDMMDPAAMFNYTETQKTERYALAPKAPYVAAEGQTEGRPEWIDANRKNYSTLLYKPTLAPNGELLPQPQRQAPAQVESGMAEWSSSAERNLMAVGGMPQENPEITARIVGGNKYLQRRQGMQDLANFKYYDKQTLAIQWTGMLLLERIPFYYDTQRQQRIIGEDGQPEMITINERQQGEDGVERTKNDMKFGKYSVVMDTGPDYATSLEENAEKMTELLDTPLGEPIVKTGADVVLRNYGFPGASELADRVATTVPGALDKIMEGLPKQAQTIIGTLQQQLQQAQQTIEEQGREIKYRSGIQQQKDDASDQRNVRDNVTKLNLAKMDQHTRLDIEDTKAATSRDVAEIHGATQLLNTRAESIHDEQQAQKLIEAGTTDRAP